MSLRVTLGVRLGLAPRGTRPPPVQSTCDDPVDTGGVPEWVRPETVIRLVDLPSCATVPVEVPNEFIDEPGPPRVRGEMIWLHKTAPTLVIEGRRGLTPEEHAAGRRR